MSQLARLLRPVLLALALLVPLQAQAFQITVSGVTYELSTVNTSYDTSSALLESQPWWTGTGDATLANTFANAFLSAGGNVGPDLSTANALFTYDSSPGFAASIRVSGTTNLGTDAISAALNLDHVTATVDDRVVLDAQWSRSVSKNPFLEFRLRDVQPGARVVITWEDNRGERMRGEAVVK